MARVVLTKTTAPGGYAAASVACTFTAADTSDLDSFVPTGEELILVWNTNAGVTAHTWTLTSVADPRGRLGSITTESVAAGTIRCYGPLPLLGWKQTDGAVYLQADHAEIKFAIIKLPG